MTIIEFWALIAAVRIYIIATLHGTGFRVRVRPGCMTIIEFWAHRRAVVRIYIIAALHGTGFRVRVRTGCMAIN
jgi:hypothetical protein